MPYWLVVIGNLFEMDSLIGVAAAVGGVILAPISYTGLGLTLKDSNERELETPWSGEARAPAANRAVVPTSVLRRPERATTILGASLGAPIPCRG